MHPAGILMVRSRKSLRRVLAPNNSLMLTRLAGEKSAWLARQAAREWWGACLSRRAA